MGEHSIPASGRLPPVPELYTGPALRVVVAVPRTLRNWLLGEESDPSVRYRVLREILEKPEDNSEVVRSRGQIGRKGWVAQILRLQQPAGHWDAPGTSARELYRPKYIATNWRLLVLADLGVSGKHPRVAKAVDLFFRRFSGPSGDLGGRRSEVCFTGNAVRMLVRFCHLDDPRLKPAIDWLVRHQKADGGWHCFPSRTGTLDAWEALSAFAALPTAARTPSIVRAIERGADFYLHRGLTREGRTRYRPWFRLHYPVHYYYDFLVGLDVLTALGYGDDARIRPALDRLEAMRNPDGSWNLDALHPDSEDPDYQIRGPFYPFGLEVAGRPSRTITTTALAVLKRAGR